MANIKVNKLSFSYSADIPVLKGIDLLFYGESTAIVGQNGAGKTTFVKLLKGLLKPVTGEILLDGQNIEKYTAAALSKHIGMVFQNPNDQVFKNKVIQEVMFGPLNIGQDEQIAKENALKALQKVGLEHSLDKNPYDLSLAERKMVATASILAMETDVVIFDEPTMGQDLTGKERLKKIIAELRSEGKLVICILHDMDFTAEVLERTVVFNQGAVLLDGPTRDVFTNKQILKQAYLEQPQVMQIAERLAMSGIYLTVEELYKNKNL